MRFHPLTPRRWTDFETLFGPKGAYAGCWCMYWRVTRREFAAGQGAGNRRAMRSLVHSGHVPGILGYAGREPIAWCSVAPREHFASLERSPVLKRLDDEPVWSLVCLYIARTHRHRGIALEAILAAVEHVRHRRGRIVEAYPTVARSDRVPPVSAYMGFPELFERAGFVECAQPSASRRIMRRHL
ncbi:MAG: GNAT family N-acetyltransferase [Candidatus Eiseniibacteriota bacterium]|jgi:hypothetical protein